MFQQNQILTANEYFFGEIKESRQGRGSTLLYNKRHYSIVGQDSHLPPLHGGDEVRFIWHEDGAYIVGRRLSAQESPMVGWQQINHQQLELNFGQCILTLDHSGKISIKTPASEISINNDGEIFLTGKKMYYLAEDEIHIDTKQGPIHIGHPSSVLKGNSL